MITLTIQIPDAEADQVTQIIKEKGGAIIANSKGNLSEAEQISLNRSLKEAELVHQDKLKGFTFDELWGE